jgi:hypothetical protein
LKGYCAIAQARHRELEQLDANVCAALHELEVHLYASNVQKFP